MGLTISNRHQQMYSKWRNEGLSHEQAINNVPKGMRKSFIKDLDKSPFESHFGMNAELFFLILVIVIIGTIIFANLVV